MAGFCVSCGSPAGGQSGFCGNCGARAGQAPSQPPAAPIGIAPSPAAGGSALKIILIVVVILFGLGVLSVAGMYFTARHYVKVAENITGVKAGDVVSSLREAGARSSAGARETRRDGCLLLSKEEASAILGIQVERVNGKPNAQESGEHCDFFVKPETVEQNTEKLKQAADAVKSDPNTPSKPDQLPPGAADMIKTLNRGVIEGARNGEAPYFAFTVERENGKLAFTAFQMADRLGGGSSASDPIGIGDKAALGIGESRLCVLKGNSAFTLDLSQVTGARAKGVALAKTILARL
jgi:hypothetical protein